MMIVVPTFAHGQKRNHPHIAALYRCSANFPDDGAVVVGKIANHPVTEDTGTHPRTHPPEYETPPS